MAEDQRNARIFGVLFIITFLTSIPALASLPTRSRRSGRVHRRRREGQPDLPGRVPGVPAHHLERRNGRCALPDREATERAPRHRLRRCAHHRVRLHRGRDHLRARSRQPAPGLSGRGRPAVSLAALKDWTFLFGPGFIVPFGNGLILGYLMYTLGPRPAAHGLARTDRRPAPPVREHRHALRLVGRRQHGAGPPGHPRVPVGGVRSASTRQSGDSGGTLRSFRPAHVDRVTRARSRTRGASSRQGTGISRRHGVEAAGNGTGAVVPPLAPVARSSPFRRSTDAGAGPEQSLGVEAHTSNLDVSGRTGA